jgi:hypothetical protein
MKTKIKHGTTEPVLSNLCEYQLGFCDKTKHLFIRDGEDNIIDIMGWIDANTGERVDTLQDFFGQIVWRIYIEGNYNLDTGITIPQFIEIKENVNNVLSDISVTNIVNYGGNLDIKFTSGQKEQVLMPVGYTEFTLTYLNTVSIIPVGRKVEKAPATQPHKLWLVGQTHKGLSIDGSKGIMVNCRMYIDFTDGTVRGTAQ